MGEPEFAAGANGSGPLGTSPQGNGERAAARTSDLLAALAGKAEARITLGEVVDGLSERGFGLVTLLLALPNGLPGPSVPGLSALTGLPLALIAAQMAAGRREPALPAWLRRRSMGRRGFARAVQKLRPLLERLELVVRPRYPRMTGPRAERLLGLWITFAALIMCNPLPLSNFPMGWGLSTLAIGLIERDGAAVMLGLLISGIGVAWNLLLVWFGSEAIDWAWRLVAA